LDARAFLVAASSLGLLVAGCVAPPAQTGPSDTSSTSRSTHGTIPTRPCAHLLGRQSDVVVESEAEPHENRTPQPTSVTVNLYRIDGHDITWLESKNADEQWCVWFDVPGSGTYEVRSLVNTDRNCDSWFGQHDFEASHEGNLTMGMRVRLEWRNGCNATPQRS
jgi:hypothetical protein